jgi:DNA-binding response OmpR family regulator
MLAPCSTLPLTSQVAANCKTNSFLSLSHLFSLARATVGHFAHQSTVLIVEEQPIPARLLAFALRRSGFRPLIAHTPREVDLCLAHYPVEMVIVGLQPQRGGGLQLVRALRGQARYQQMPILGMSSQPSYALERMALKMGVTRYMVRPLRPHQLARAIHELLYSCSALSNPSCDLEKVRIGN